MIENQVIFQDFIVQLLTVNVKVLKTRFVKVSSYSHS